MQNCILAEQTARNQPSKCQTTNPKCQGCRRHLPRQSTHPTDVKDIVHRVHDRTGAKEKQSLEEGMSDEMVEASNVSAETASKEHVAELADG